MASDHESGQALKRAWWLLHFAWRSPREAARELLWEKPIAWVARALRWHARQAGVSLPLGRHTSLRVAQSLLFGVNYEQAERELLDRHLEPTDSVLELGTGLGLIATLAARRVGGNRVYTFEANPALIAVARETFRVNGVAPVLEACALGSEEGSMDFYLEPDFWSSSTTARSGRAKHIRVPVRSLEAELARLEPSFMVVDIEGGEVDLFRNVAIWPSVRRLMIEMHPDVVGHAALQDMLSRLENQGFRVQEKVEENNVLLVRAP